MRLKELKIPNHVAQLAVHYATAGVRIESVVIPLLIYRIMIDRLELCLLRMIRIALFALCILSSSYTSTIVGVLEVVDYGYAASIF
ncbi:hypothetical protein ACTXJJ_13955 [Corynebacterium casei]|uniref:hypothetical protein n=1 Tax=Corynebacterium casei TaxID=160386 RepID=UPI001867DEBB|nr:hypothetical protein [Corynebacterium casei]